MKIADDELGRLAELARIGILDSDPELSSDEVVKLAASICGTPMALITLVDQSRQWFKAKVGIEINETSREISFCTHAIQQDGLFVVEDARQSPVFRDNPLVTGDPNVRFYAGAPLRTRSGHKLGTLCVVDQVPRSLTAAQAESLQILARQVVANFEHRRLIQESAHREKFLNETLSMISGLVSYVTPDLVYTYANASYCRWFNLSLDRVIGRSIPDLVGPAAFKKVESYIQRALEGEEQHCETTIEISGVMQQYRIVEAHYKPHIENGVVKGLYIFVNDVTETARAKQEAILQSAGSEAANRLLETTVSEFRAIFDYAPVGMAELDSSRRLVRFNPAFCKMLEYEPHELVGRSITELTSSDDLARSVSAWEKVEADEDIVEFYEKSYISKSGRLVRAQVSTRMVRHPSGERRIFGVLQDVSEQRQREHELKLVQAKLIANSKLTSLGEMAGGIAHEINNPLAIIQGRAALLQQKIARPQFDLEEVRKGLEVISKTSSRISTIVSGLRTFSSPQQIDPNSRFLLSQLVEDTIALCGERYKQNSVSLNCESVPNVQMVGHPVQLSQVLMNLLSNAFDAVVTRPGAWVRVSCEITDKQIGLRVSDSGTGIPVKVVEQMMMPFFTTKDAGKGTGLGLSISSGIVTSHGGQLNYELHDGHTSFVIRLPLRAQQVAA